MRDEAEFTGYAVARWETLVRTAVLLGLPLSAAPPLAAEAIARARSGLAERDGAYDPDVELFSELMAAHHRDRRRWWSLPPTVADAQTRALLGPVEEPLDRLTQSARARLVLKAVALLPQEQVDQIVAAGSDLPNLDLVTRTAAAAGAVAVAPIDLDVVWAGSRGRTRGRLAVSALAVAVTLVLAALSGASVASRLGAGEPVAERGLPSAATQTFVTTMTIGVPVAWYSGGVLHLHRVDVPLAEVVALNTLAGGVVATTKDGRLLEVDSAGRVSRIAKVAPGSEVATSSTGNLVAYIGDAPHELTVFDARSGAVLAKVPVDAQAEVVAVDGLATYVNDSDGHFVVQFGDAARRTNGVTVLDAAGGVLVVASEQGEIQIVRDGTPLLTTVGEGAELSPSGRFALIRRAEGVPALQVVEVEGGRTIPLPLLDGDAITDAAFAADDSLVFVARGPFAPPSRDRDNPATTPRRSDLITCDLSTGSCTRSLRLGAASTGPLLAH